MSNRKMNPIIMMLSWRAKKLKAEDVEKILSAIASISEEPFTLTDVIKRLPDDVKIDRNKRRRVGNLLQALVSIGYLSKPSERKWIKNAPTLSHFLSQHLLELSSIEMLSPRLPPAGGRVIGRRQKLDQTSSA